MRYELIDYQRAAAIQVLRWLARSRRDWDEDRALSAFALSAVTGSGKTVIATAVIEALLHSSADLEVDADPNAVFLWVTDDPALNRQTRNKMLAASDLLDPTRLVILDNDFVDPQLRPGRVYFLNIQKLSKGSGLAQGGTNQRQYSMWDVIANTVGSDVTRLYLVLDEAHRGMKPAPDRGTIVQRIIGGQQGSNPPVPVAWGISATIERFTTAMAGSTNRITYPAVAIDIEDVRASGIIKDRINLDEPTRSGSFSTTLLRDAVAATLEFEHRWESYSQAQNEPLVKPVLVVQVNDKSSLAQMTELLGVVEKHWPDLDQHAVVNVFGEHSDLAIGKRRVRYVQPEAIQDEDSIRVVLAKQAISTGWDCPRAEVLFSERAATDATHIAQLIGRMVRSPLAHRIATDDALNAVSCYLPRFNRVALTKITDELTKPGEPGEAMEITVNARLFERNSSIEPAAFEYIQAMPSLPPPKALASPLRRAKSLAKLLTDDRAPGGALLPNAGEHLSQVLNSRLDGLAAEYATEVRQNTKDIETALIRQTVITTGGETVATSTRTERADPADVDRDTRRILSRLKEGVAKDYLRHRVERAGRRADVHRIRTEVAALLMIEVITSDVEAAATRWVQERFDQFAVEIKNTTGAIRDAYQKVKEQTSTPEITSVELPDSLLAATRESNKEDAQDLPTFRGHLYSDGQGNFPAKLNDWETTVIKREIGRPSFVAWYRNPSRSVPSSLRIAYVDDAGDWKPLQVDFIVISRRDDGTMGASIIDPHGDHLADAKAKLRGLADFAEAHGDSYVRIESIAKVSDGRLRSIDMLDPNARAAVRAFVGGKVTGLYESRSASDYK